MNNNCDIITLFDLGLNCNIIQSPTSPTSYDGSLSILVTGGTAPYSYNWSGGQKTQTITNLGYGNYGVTVVDFYGDFTASTICSLIAPSPSPTPTPTPTPTSTPVVIPDNLCLIITSQSQQFSPIEFTRTSNVNGRPSWLSGSYQIEWNLLNSTWQILGWNLTSGLPVSSSQSLVPLSSWNILGGTGGPYTLTMSQGTCPAILPLTSIVTKQNTTCSGNQNCDGSIQVVASGGVPPYQYSINNGTTFQSSNIFNGVCSGTYTVVTKDSVNTTVNNTTGISSQSSPTTYLISLTSTGTQNPNPQTRVSNWQLNVSPVIPIGTTITFNMVVNTTKKYNSPGGGIITDGIIVNKNSVLQVATSSTQASQFYTRPQCSPYTTQLVNENETYTLTITNGDVVNGSFTSVLNITDPQIGDNGCVTNLDQSILATLTNSNIAGCTCCQASLVSLPIGITEHVIQSGTNEVVEPPAYRQILLSNPPGSVLSADACEITSGLPKYIAQAAPISNGLIIYNDTFLSTKTYTSDPYGGNYAMLFDLSTNTRYAVTFDGSGNVNTVTNC